MNYPIIPSLHPKYSHRTRLLELRQIKPSLTLLPNVNSKSYSCWLLDAPIEKSPKPWFSHSVLLNGISAKFTANSPFPVGHRPLPAPQNSTCWLDGGWI